MRILFSLLLCLTVSMLPGQSRIQRVEPPNWWIGMQHTSIQLIVYGDKVAELSPRINTPGLSLARVIQVPNPNYLFLDLEIQPDAKPGQVAIEFYKQDQLAATHPFELLERQPDRLNLEGFTNSDAIYLITPDRFANGDPSNDNTPGMREKADRQNKGGRHGGDIAGMLEHLDYIEDLGFTALWVNPVLENNMPKFSYHGYSTTDFYRVDPRFGSNESYRELVAAARNKGMKFIMDMIVNHCGLEHWWMKDLPSDDWINQWETYTQTNHRKTVWQDPYVSDIDKKIFADGWFVPTMPDLNQRNDLLARYLIQNTIWWVEYLGLNGIRMDTYPYPDMEFMADWTKALMLEYPGLNIVGEEWYENPVIVAYWQQGKENANGYTSDLKSVMDFPLQMAMVKALNHEEGFKTGWIEYYEMLALDFLYADPHNLVTFPDNHDMSRIFTQLNEDFDLFKQAMVLTLTMRGIPQIYYGTEILMKNPGTDDHGIIRSDFPGGWAGDRVNGFTGNGLSTQQIDASSYLKALLQWRKTATAVHRGQVKHFLPEAGVYVYFRFDASQKVMVVLNKNTEATALALSRFSEELAGYELARDVLSKQSFLLDQSLSIPARGVMVLELSQSN